VPLPATRARLARRSRPDGPAGGSPGSAGAKALDRLFLAWNTPPMRIAARIAALRAQRGWTQEELARRARLNRAYLARLETDRHAPTLATLQKLAKALRVTVSALIE
jgi:DNA-binding XRE family transcriptional regulator